MRVFRVPTMAASKLLKTRLLDGSEHLPPLYLAGEVAVEEIRKEFASFPGGSVDLLQRPDGIGIITLNNPEKRNAITGKMMGDFLDVMDVLEHWQDAKGVILKGVSGNFCSGGDLSLARGTGNADAGHRMATLMDSVLTRLQALPAISVALVEGCGALGGGAEVCVACDYRLVTRSCQGIGFVHGRMSIIPAWGGTGRLVAAVGYRSALDLLTTARVCRPEDSLRIGLVDQILDEENAESEAISWIQARTNLTTAVVRGLKSTALLARGDPEVSDLEKRIFAPFWGCDANKAALAANIKHRPR